MKTYIIEQKFTALSNQYRVFGANEQGEKAELICFAQQKRFTFREEIQLYTDEAKQALAFTVKAEKVMDIHGKFLVRDPEGKELGALRKAFGASLLRSTWEIMKEDEMVAIVQEKNQAIAIFRRIWQFTPFLSEIPFFVKYHFVFIAPEGENLGTYYKTTLFRDHYRLDITDDKLLKTVGWQTLVAQAVLLDALQGR